MKARKGFTLIELLIVMAIIAALMAVLIPMATGAMKKANATKIAVQLRNLEQGTEQYVLSTLPDEPSGGDPSNPNGNIVATAVTISDAGFADEDFAKDSNLKILYVTGYPSKNKIRIDIKYSPGDSSLAELIKGSLKDAYEVKIDANSDITITSTVDAFWW